MCRKDRCLSQRLLKGNVCTKGGYIADTREVKEVIK